MSHLIQIADNSPFRQELEEVFLDNLKKMAEKPISQIVLDDNPNLLIFPQDYKTYGDDIGKEHIFNVKEGKLWTGNIMGFIGFKDTKVRIHSRFDQKEEKDFFLHYMLQKVFAINLFDLKYNSDEESIFDFLLYLFPSALKLAMRQGLYKEYQTRRYNDQNIRGHIDVKRHIRLNYPFTGKVAYSTREYAYDNHVTQLVRHTIEYIAEHPFGGNILHNDDATRDAVTQIKEATPTYSRNERRRVVYLNLRPVRHPYFYEYRNLQRLCLQILRHEELKYGRDDDQIYGVLFDGAWLWEEYLNTFLKDLGFKHPRNKEGTGGRRIFSDKGGERVMPDFHSENMILDAKYKGYSDWTNVGRDDRFQLLAYMYLFGISHSAFVVPVDTASLTYPTRLLNGPTGKMSIFGLNVALNNKGFDEYCSHMKKEEGKLMSQIKHFL